MKARIFTLSILAILFFSFHAWSQCEPMSPEECPDPENNGEICPDTLAIGMVGEPYNQEFTILPPSEYEVPGMGTVTLSYIKLKSIDNLPPGINWESNSPDSIFLAGEYYCVLLSGIPTEADSFYLKIVVDAYVIVLPGLPPIPVPDITDSTSLAILVVPASGIPEFPNTNLYASKNYPNPFSTWTSIQFKTKDPGTVSLDVYTILGELIYSDALEGRKGQNYFHIDGTGFSKGAYFYRITDGNEVVTGIMVKKE